MTLSETSQLKSLGSDTEYKFDGADKRILERFPNPMNKGPGVCSVHISSPEDKFTSLCPLTGQPDYADMVVNYYPRDWCVESKSWKMYLNSFRNVGEFHESVVRRISNALIELLDPWSLTLTGEFTPRGGIQFWPKVDYTRPEMFFDIPSDSGLLEDKNSFFIGESTFEKLSRAENDLCRLVRGKDFIGTARIAECEVGEWDEMARKYAATNYLYRDRSRLKAGLEQSSGYDLENDMPVTVVWFKDVNLFIQENVDSSDVLPLEKKD